MGSARVILLLLLCGGCRAVRVAPSAELTSQTNAVDVPVILDASSISNAQTYLWTQTGGVPLEIIGQDRVKAMIISAGTPSTNQIQLVTTTLAGPSTTWVQVVVVPRQGRTLYVDNTLTNNCLSGNYSVANRNGSGQDGNAYTNLQAAADVTIPGDLVSVRGGTFTNPVVTGVYNYQLKISRSGTATQPIRYEVYPGESVLLWGHGFIDQDLNGDGKADGPIYGKREYLIYSLADYIQLKGFEVANSEYYGINTGGNFNYLENCNAHDCWYATHAIEHPNATTNTLLGTVLRWCEGHHARHGNGGFFYLNSTTFAFMTGNAFVNCVFHENGYQADGNKVLPITGDPEGGGNSDGLTVSKNLANNASFHPEYGVDNWGPQNFWVGNISYGNCDDGFDSSWADSLIEGNMSLKNGPTGNKGFKMFLTVNRMTYRGNFSWGNTNRGFELRNQTNSALVFYGNTALTNVAQGILGLDSNCLVTNNLAAFNGGPAYAGTVPPAGRNWSDDGTGSPGFRGDPQLASADNFQLDTHFQPGWSVQQKWQFLEGQLRAAFSPRAGSPLIDAGLWIAGYHCPRADDDPRNPMPTNAPGKHWFGAAPDIGMFEFTKPSPGAAPLPVTNVWISPLTP